MGALNQLKILSVCVIFDQEPLDTANADWDDLEYRVNCADAIATRMPGDPRLYLGNISSGAA